MVLGRVCTVLGVEPERAWRMEWMDISALYRYWRDSPPVHELVAAAVKFKPAPREVDRTRRPDLGMTFDELRRAIAAGAPLFSAGA